jgi:hypothetical protein
MEEAFHGRPRQNGNAMATNSPYPYQPLLYDDSTRLLILEPGNFTDPIRCRLEHHRLGDKPQYAAVSYTWGEELPTHQICIDGFLMEVRDNLRQALLHFCNKEVPRTLWIDAVCLNQRDIPERNQQVRIMRRIYDNSKLTLVWLGDYSEADEIALQMLQRYEQTTYLRHMSPEQLKVAFEAIVEAKSNSGSPLDSIFESLQCSH